MSADRLAGLDWHLPEAVQLSTIADISANPPVDLTSLILPGNKALWENAARVIVAIGQPRIDRVLTDLSQWMQDMNWPGAALIYDFFRRAENVDGVLAERLDHALSSHDKDWAENIRCLIAERQRYLAQGD